MEKTLLRSLGWWSVGVLIALVLFLLLEGCAATKKGMWQGDWDWARLKWVAETNLDGDVPRTIIQNKNGTVLVFQ